jgi:hypothetical protein
MLLFLVLTVVGASVTSGNSASSEASAAPPATPIPATLFGMHVHVHGPHAPYPTAPIGSFRMLENLTSWAALNRSPGNYDWRVMDAQLVALKEHGTDDVLYTFDKTPSWASSQPDHDCVEPGPMAAFHVAHKMFPGLCDPPNDLNPDGGGSDQHWKDYVTAIATHAKNAPGARIKYWEIWNEPHNQYYWDGTFPQMVRMAKDAYAIIKGIDPGALILCPSGVPRWLDQYLAAGGGEYTDVVSVHAYYGSAPQFIPMINQVREILANHQLNKPIWDSEGSWGNASRRGFDDDYQSAFIAQYYILHWSNNVPRLYWFAWNDGAMGTLWIQEPGNPNGAGTVTKAAGADAEVYHWLVGSTMTRACSLDSDLWTCGLTRPDGHEAVIVWADHDQKNYVLKASLKKMRDLDGQQSAVSGPIRIGIKPVLLESQ